MFSDNVSQQLSLEKITKGEGSADKNKGNDCCTESQS